MSNLVDDMRFGAIEHSDKDGFSALENDAKNRGGNQQSNNGIGQRIAKPDAEGAEQHG